MEPRHFQLFAGTASLDLAQKIAEYDGCGLSPYTLTRFSDGEMQPMYQGSIRGSDVFIIQSTYPPADHLMELFLMMDAARRSSARYLTIVVPYFGYSRQDRKDQPRVSIGASLVAKLLQAAGAQRLVTMDLHSGQIQGFFDIPLDNLDASAVFVPYIADMNLTDLVVASPDMGGVSRARLYASNLHAELVLVDKHRKRANQVSSMQIIGNVKDKHVLIVDDIVDTAGTLCKAADYIMEKGAKSVRAAITHPLLSGDAIEKIDRSSLTTLLTTDTIPKQITSPKIQVISIAPIFAKALRKIYNYESVSSLFLT